MYLHLRGSLCANYAPATDSSTAEVTSSAPWGAVLAGAQCRLGIAYFPQCAPLRLIPTRGAAQDLRIAFSEIAQFEIVAQAMPLRVGEILGPGYYKPEAIPWPAAARALQYEMRSSPGISRKSLRSRVTRRAPSRTAAVAMSRSMAPALRPERLSVPTILPYWSANASSG
jgi:hypothetical protein